MMPAALELTAEQAAVLNDDRIGRALDELLASDRVALLTDFVLRMVREFQVRLDELHNDSTSLTFQGDYKNADGRKVDGIPTHRITFGHNKDFRPDLKQLLWILTVSSDGAVPVHFKVDDGNVGDPTTHIETWNLLRQLVGGAEVFVCRRLQALHQRQPSLHRQTTWRLHHRAAQQSQGGRLVPVVGLPS